MSRPWLRFPGYGLNRAHCSSGSASTGASGSEDLGQLLEDHDLADRRRTRGTHPGRDRLPQQRCLVLAKRASANRTSKECSLPSSPWPDSASRRANAKYMSSPSPASAARSSSGSSLSTTSEALGPDCPRVGQERDTNRVAPPDPPVRPTALLHDVDRVVGLGPHDAGTATKSRPVCTRRGFATRVFRPPGTRAATQRSRRLDEAVSALRTTTRKPARSRTGRTRAVMSRRLVWVARLQSLVRWRWLWVSTSFVWGRGPSPGVWGAAVGEQHLNSVPSRRLKPARESTALRNWFSRDPRFAAPMGRGDRTRAHPADPRAEACVRGDRGDRQRPAHTALATDEAPRAVQRSTGRQQC